VIRGPRCVSSSVAAGRNLNRNHRKIAEFASHCDRIWLGGLFADDGGTIVFMAAPIRFPIGSTALVSAFQLAILGVVGPADTARAADCLTAPGSPGAPNSHWYYRTDKTDHRKCWYLRDGSGASQDDTVTTTQSVPSAAPYSLESFKAFMAQRGIANLSDKDVEGLYAEFLAWRRRPENQAKQN
jgi:hypothetical protein